MTDTNVATIQNKSPIVVLRERFIDRRSELKAALGTDQAVDHFIRTLVTSAQINPEIQACSFSSIWLSAMRACRDELEVDGVEAALVPFKSTCSYIAMYRGLLKKFWRSGLCKWAGADVVRQGEAFEHYVDENGEHFKHIPGDDSTAPVVKVYAAAMTKDGAFFVAVMTMTEIEKIRKMSKASREDAPWKAWPEEMMKKTALRRLSKLLPSSRLISVEDDSLFLPSIGDGPTLAPAAPEAPVQERVRGAAAMLDQFASSTDAPLTGGPTPQSTPSAGEQDGGGESGKVGSVPDDAAAGPNDDAGAQAPSEDAITEAYERGMKAKADGFTRKAIPPEYRTPERSHEQIAWQAGFDGKDMPTW